MKKFHQSALALFLLIAFISIQSVGLIRGRSAGDSERAVDKTQASRITLDRAGLSERVTLHVGQRSAGVNLQDGHDLIAAYTGPLELKEAMERNQAPPLALASGDYDEDHRRVVSARYRAVLFRP